MAKGPRGRYLGKELPLTKVQSLTDSIVQKGPEGAGGLSAQAVVELPTLRHT